MLFLNKKKLFQLDRRLQTCASMVRENQVLADIGTDHAYLPIWLVKKGVSKGNCCRHQYGAFTKSGI